MRRYIVALLVVLGLLVGAAPASAQVYWYAVNGNIFASGPVLFTDGTAAAPAMAFASGTNYGWYRSGTVLHLSANGSSRWQFDGNALYSSTDGLGLIGAVASLRPGAVNIGGRTVTVNTQPALNIAETWNEGSTTFTGILGNWTNTASASGSKVIDLQVGGQSRLNVTVGGTLNLGPTSGNTTSGTMSVTKTSTVCTIDTDTGCTGKTTGTVTMTSGSLPVGLILGITCKNTVAITGSASFASYSVGDGSDVDRWGTGILKALNTTVNIANFTTASPAYQTTAGSLVFTANGAETFTAGVISCTVYSINFTPIGS